MSVVDPHLEPTSRGSLGRHVLQGSGRFALVSVAAFSVWAFGGRLFGGGHAGEMVLYAMIAAVFATLSGVLLHPLVRGSRPVARFYSVFVPAFMCYAVVWSALWFALGFGPGEWAGSACGSLTFVAFAAWRLGGCRGFWSAAAAFFVFHTAGYFLGGWSMVELLALARREPAPVPGRAAWIALAKLSWGWFYGLGFGAGLGWVFHAFQRPRPR